jgi:hypothetical protein
LHRILKTKGERRGRGGKQGEMTQTLYAHMSKRKEKKKTKGE